MSHLQVARSSNRDRKDAVQRCRCLFGQVRGRLCMQQSDTTHLLHIQIEFHAASQLYEPGLSRRANRERLSLSLSYNDNHCAPEVCIERWPIYLISHGHIVVSAALWSIVDDQDSNQGCNGQRGRKCVFAVSTRHMIVVITCLFKPCLPRIECIDLTSYDRSLARSRPA